MGSMSQCTPSPWRMPIASKGREVLSNLLVSTHQFPECPSERGYHSVGVALCGRKLCGLRRRKSAVVSRLQHAKDILAGCGLGNRRQRAKSTQRVQLRDESCRGVLSGRSSCRAAARLDSKARYFGTKRHDFRDKCGVGDWLDDFAKNRLFCVIANPTMDFVQLSGEPRMTVRCRQQVVDDGSRDADSRCDQAESGLFQGLPPRRLGKDGDRQYGR